MVFTGSIDSCTEPPRRRRCGEVVRSPVHLSLVASARQVDEGRILGRGNGVVGAENPVKHSQPCVLLVRRPSFPGLMVSWVGMYA